MSKAPATAPAHIAQIPRREISKCVTCGLCNSACPTFATSGREPDGPRGRLHFIARFLEEGDGEGLVTLDGCLRCNLCSDACPTGVDFSLAVRGVELQRTEAEDDLATLRRLAKDPGLTASEKLYFDTVLTAALRAEQAPAASEAASTATVGIVPGPILAAAGADVVERAAALMASVGEVPRVLEADPGSGLLELGCGRLFRTAAEVFGSEIASLGLDRVVILDPWVTEAARIALRAESIEGVELASWTAWLAGRGGRLAGTELVDCPTTADGDVQAMVGRPQEVRFLPQRLRAHASPPAGAAAARQLQRALQDEVEALAVRYQPCLTVYPLSLHRLGGSRFIGLEMHDG